MGGPEFDAVIAGGGLSGLSLAARLATGGWRHRRVLLVDDPAGEPTERWGFWSTGGGLLDAAVSQRYAQVRICAGGESRVLPLGRYRYQVVRRPDLRRVVLELLGGCPGFTVRAGRVQRLETAAGAAVTTVDGEVVRSSWAFDSVTRPPPAPGRARGAGGGQADVWLAFTGWEVDCARPAFRPDLPTLFDFRTSQAGTARFGYVLPEGRHRALVELTEFGPRHAGPPGAGAHRQALDRYLRDIVHSGQYTVRRAESAVLPLRVRPAGRRSGRILAIGARAGLIKASTGYAYERIQRDSAAIAASLDRREHPFDLPPPRPRHRLLDALLLDVFDRDPSTLERAFARLFAANPVERVLAFLDEDTGVPDELRLMATLPAAPYLRALARYPFRAR